MSRISEPSEKLTKAQVHNKRNSSSVFEMSSNKNATKTEKPFNVNGKDIYVIESNADTDNADVQIVHNKQYEDRSSFLFQTKWPDIPGVPSDMLNGKCDEASSTISGTSSDKPARSSSRSKSSNILDHFNQESRNANRDVPSSATSSRYPLRKRKLS